MLGSGPARQASIFTGSTIVVSVLGVVTTAILARRMTEDVFGSYAFAVSFLAFAALFFEFGLFPPAARLAALRTGEEAHAIVGAGLVLYLPLLVAFSLFAFASSFFVDQVFDVNAGSAIRVAAPLVGGVPFVLVSQQLSQGVDRLYVWSVTQVLFQALFLLLLVLAPFTLSITAALVFRMLALAVASLIAAWWLRPVFRHVVQYAREIVRDTRSYGFSMYVGRLLSIGTYNMDVLMLGAFRDGRTVGYYTLAASVAGASGLPVQGLATALFRRMATAVAISRQVIVFSAVGGLASALVATLLAGPFIEHVFSARYAPAVALVFPLALAQAVRGVTGIYNTYLSAQAKGRELRSANVILTTSNAALNVTLIPAYGATGAAWASFVALVINLGAHVFYYRRSLAPVLP